MTLVQTTLAHQLRITSYNVCYTKLLRIDRPQKYSNVVPAPYGFIPQTYCGAGVGNYCAEKTGKKDIMGDRDPLDILLLTEKDITHGNIIAKAIPIGGFRMLDGNAVV